MTNPSKDLHQKANELFAKAVELPEADQSASLIQQCRSDTDLLRNVESLLGFDTADDEDDFGVVVANDFSISGSRDRLFRRGHLRLKAAILVATLLGCIGFAASLRSGTRGRVADTLQSSAGTYVRAIRAWE